MVERKGLEKLKLLQEAREVFEARVADITVDDAAHVARAKASNLENLCNEVKWDLLHVKTLWDSVKDRIQAEMESPENTYGCLDGQIDDYM